MSEAAIQIRDLGFAYPQGRFRLDMEELWVPAGERVAIIGSSGCGKTTLVQLMAGLRLPDRGDIEVLGTRVSSLSDAARRNFRIANIGFVFQSFELVDYLSVEENILLPYFINASLPLTADVRRRTAALAESVGLGDRRRRLPGQLSQGERQRLALCRALVTGPRIVIADEPTGNLDPETTASIMQLILDTVAEQQATFVMITHDHGLLDSFDRVIDLADTPAEGGPD